jgi:hypothetical protein
MMWGVNIIEGWRTSPHHPSVFLDSPWFLGLCREAIHYTVKRIRVAARLFLNTALRINLKPFSSTKYLEYIQVERPYVTCKN